MHHSAGNVHTTLVTWGTRHFYIPPGEPACLPRKLQAYLALAATPDYVSRLTARPRTVNQHLAAAHAVMQSTRAKITTFAGASAAADTRLPTATAPHHKRLKVPTPSLSVLANCMAKWHCKRHNSTITIGPVCLVQQSSMVVLPKSMFGILRSPLQNLQCQIRCINLPIMLKCRSLRVLPLLLRQRLVWSTTYGINIGLLLCLLTDGSCLPASSQLQPSHGMNA
jgi:hypothetical protein